MAASCEKNAPVAARVKVLMALLLSFAAFPLGRPGLLALSVVMASLIVFGRLSSAMWRGLRRSIIPLFILFTLNCFAASPMVKGEKRRDDGETRPSSAASIAQPNREGASGAGRGGDGQGRRRDSGNRGAGTREQVDAAAATREGREGGPGMTVARRATGVWRRC